MDNVNNEVEELSPKKKNWKRQKKNKAVELPPLPQPVVDISKLFSFTLDRFQLEAINAIDRNENVVVTAPTGSGKTVIAEYAIHRALTHGKRCFYTTPLKALSNQKFLDLRERYGEDKVGLLTGDISVNRNAFIVVMTTEVYRNILYGTVLGDVRSNLNFVESVIVDECHYMNDPDRGTVWEELVIYSPANIQLISLSATVANAQDLCDWITKVHGQTSLIESSYRPVPLFINYFVGGEIFSFMNKSGKVNKLIRRRIEEVNEERRIRRKKQSFEESDIRQIRERVREEKNKICADVVRALDAKDMLPAIYFLFSRKRCDEAARFCSRSVVKLSKEHRRQLEEAVEEAVKEHPSLSGSEHLEYIRHGVAAHHAGLLPILKSVVEDLFKRGLIKVVFATETLAAGINMPARTTIISATVKKSDEGVRPISASEFLQMSGRAGRRGMDKIGNVIIVHSPREDFEEIVTLVKSAADPLISHYTPSYGMVLNLLQVHTREEAKSLVEKSFGQFVIEQHRGEYGEQYNCVLGQIKRYSDKVACTEQKLGDGSRWKGLQKRINDLSAVVRSIKRHMSDEEELNEKERATLEIHEQEINKLKDEASSMHCQTCSRHDRCAKDYRALLKFKKQLAHLDELIEQSKTSYWRQFLALEEVLLKMGYLQEDHKPNWKGEMASSLRATNILLLSEILLSGVLEDLEAAQLTGVVSSLVTGEVRTNESFIPLRPSEKAEETIKELCAIALRVDTVQAKHDVSVPAILNSIYAGLIEFWAYGTTWEDVRDRLVDIDEGDLVKAIRRTIDILRQFAHAPHVSEKMINLCREAEMLLDRDEVHDAVIWTE